MGFNLQVKRILLLYLVPLLLGKLIDFYISNWSQDIPVINFLKKNILNLTIIDITLIIWVSLIIIMDYRSYNEKQKEKEEDLKISPLKREIDKLEKTIQEKDNLLLSKAGSLMDKYNDLQQFQENETLLKYLRVLTTSNSIIHSSQLYSYTKKVYNDKTTIKVTYINGSASEEIDINAIVQSYYHIDNNVFFPVNNILEKVNKLDVLESKKDFATLEIDSQLEELIKDEIENDIRQFIDKHFKLIKNKNFDDLDEKDSCILALSHRTKLVL